MNKHLLCQAFCQELEVSDVPSGLVVRTGFTTRDGDAIGFYITRHPNDAGQCRVEDSGLIVPMLEAAGVNLECGARAAAFHRLLTEHRASFDVETMEMHSEYVPEADLPSEAMRFVSLLLRVQDLELLNVETVANTFRDDVTADIDRLVAPKANVEYKVAPHRLLKDFEADAVIRNGDRALALYFATSDERVNEAVILWMESRQVSPDLKVALMLEREKPAQINNRSLRRAMNRLDATTVYRDDEFGSMTRVASLVGVPVGTLQ